MSDASIRLSRLFNKGRCLDIAVDHGFFGEGSFLAGIEDMDAAIKTLVNAAPDAIQLTIGQARKLQNVDQKDRPSLVLRTDVANIYGKKLQITCLVFQLKIQCSQRCAWMQQLSL